MIDGEILSTLRRNLSFFAARGAGHTVRYGRWRVKRWLQRGTRSFEVDTADLLASVKLERAQLATHFRSRSTPVFCFEEATVAEIVARIPAEQKAQTLRAADQICKNIFDLRGAGPIQFEQGIDWNYCPDGNIDWRWDLNRHTFFETLGRAYRYTGEERYANKFRELLCDWLAHNPARMDQPNWTSVFEVAFRINTWVWALYYFRSAQAFDDELVERLLAGLLAHGRYLNANLELHVPNNHLLLEAKALAWLGILFPEFQGACQWRERGLGLLEREMEEQVGADGVHGERTTLYHRIIAGELLELFVLMENNRMRVSLNLAERFARMVEFELALSKPDGGFPLLGDSAVVDTHLRFSASSGGAAFLRREGWAMEESDYWLLGTRIANERGNSVDSHPENAVATKQVADEPLRYIPDYKASLAINKSAAFPEGGYYLMKAGRGTDAHYLVFDCGPFGLPAMPNHGHADALSFELYAFGQTLLLDPGFYSTALGLDWRNFFRGTRAHNTVVVDGQDQSQLMDARRVYRPARAQVLNWISNDEFDFVDGLHDGYAHLTEPVTHRRQIFFVKPHYWVIVDVLTGHGKHCFDLYLHTAPGARAMLDAEPMTMRVENPGGVGLAIVSPDRWQTEIATGTTHPIQGWVSFRSGEKMPAPVLILTREAPTPIQFCTVLYPYRMGELPSVKVARLGMNGKVVDDPNLTALRIETPTHIDHLVIDRAPAKARVEFQSKRK